MPSRPRAPILPSAVTKSMPTIRWRGCLPRWAAGTRRASTPQRATRYDTQDPELEYHAGDHRLAHRAPARGAATASRGARLSTRSFHPFYADDARRILALRNETRRDVAALRYRRAQRASRGRWRSGPSRAHPVLLGTALLAYTFGLRHAVDADHISAIDNVTRKLMQDGKRPVGVGFFFSLGHSTIVVALSVAIAIAAAIVKTHLPALQRVGELVGTSVSALFLLVVAAINLVVSHRYLRAHSLARAAAKPTIVRALTQCSTSAVCSDASSVRCSNGRRSWKMYPIGVLFGLASILPPKSGARHRRRRGRKGLPVYAILLFPLLFTAGMSLIDTADGILMLGAYGWAFVKPMRKLYYNMVITLVSVLVALIVGGIEAASVIADRLQLRGGTCGMPFNALSGNFGTLGFIIVGVFVASWAISTAFYRLQRYDDLDTITT